MSSSRDYWLSRSGREFEAKHRMRDGADAEADRLQEQWLAAFLRERVRELGRAVRVLDVGCGFGRHARLLSTTSDIEYFGHDISTSMTEALMANPPATLAPIGERVRVDEAPSMAFAGQRFDVVFTVAVLTHNAPAAARSLLDDMATLLAADGRIVLIENPLSAHSFRESGRYGGTWRHDVVGQLAPEWNIELHPDAVPSRGVYVLSRAHDAPRRLLWNGADQAPREMRAEEVVARALHARASGAGEPSGDALRQLLEEGSFLHQLSSVLRDARAELASTNASAAPSDHASSSAPDHASFVFDAPIDSRFVNDDPRFGPLAQVFHKEWFGIRAACGSLPGTKLAITANKPLSADDLEEIVDTCRAKGIDRMLLHGMSDSMYAFAEAMHRADIALYIVWHGAAAMWVHEAERKYFELSAGLLASGVVQRLHPIRRGTDIVLGHANAYRKQLLNAVPNVRIERAAPRRSESAIAFSPSWNLLHKNLATNLAAANVANRVGTIWAMASDAVLVGEHHKKFERLRPQKQLEIMQTMAQADVVLNVSIVDCHPMVDMEALAAGTPCVRGRLFLDALEDHPYVRLTEVENMLSVEDVAHAIDRVLAVPQAEMDAHMRDYGSAMTRIALDRYAEFAELR